MKRIVRIARRASGGREALAAGAGNVKREGAGEREKMHVRHVYICLVSCKIDLAVWIAVVDLYRFGLSVVDLVACCMLLLFLGGRGHT